MRPIALLWLVTTALLATTAFAADPPADGATDAARMFAELDANHDGQLSADEIPADKQGLFARLLRTSDENKDGKLSQGEFASGIAPPPEQSRPEQQRQPPPPAGTANPEQMFQRLDANGDGKLARDEVPEPRREAFEQMFARGDKDGDGALSQREFLAAFPEFGPGARGRGAPQPPAGQPQPGNRGNAPPNPEQMFRRLDANGDGKLAPDEVPEPRREALAQMFAHGDKDGDGALSQREFLAAFAEFGPGARGRGAPQPAPGGRGGQVNPQRMFQRLDANADGKLTREEVPQQRRQEFAPMFARGDMDGDGALNEREFVRAYNQFGPGAQPGQRRGPGARGINPGRGIPNRANRPAGN